MAKYNFYFKQLIQNLLIDWQYNFIAGKVF